MPKKTAAKPAAEKTVKRYYNAQTRERLTYASAYILSEKLVGDRLVVGAITTAKYYKVAVRNADSDAWTVLRVWDVKNPDSRRNANAFSNALTR